MAVVAAYAVPHPPIIIPSVGRGEEKKIEKTSKAYAEVMRRAAAHHPDVLIFTSPHSVMYSDYFHVSPGKGAHGDLAQFRAPDANASVTYDTELIKQIERFALQDGLPAGTEGEKSAALDHGTLIPLLFIKETGFSCPIVRIGLSGLSPLMHYRFGQCIARAVETLNRKAVFIASGDLSHRLTADGPYGFAPEGPEFDSLLTAALAFGDFGELLAISPELAESAGECGWRSFQIMAGALDRKAVTHEMLSYEGPFGVGYGVFAFEVSGSDPSRNFGEHFEDKRKIQLQKIKSGEDDFVKLARLSVETYVRSGHRVTAPEGLPAELTAQRAGVFVTLKKDGQLRGCIGTTEPTTKSLADEIIQNGVSAASQDPRFEPVEARELDDLVYSVDVLGSSEEIASPEALNPKQYGVIVQSVGRRGLLLPDLEGVDTVSQQISIARRKAGISANEPVRLFRFQVVRHH